ncbi:hypothetical protein BCR32DRAFT_195791, partial [Anaeromyces robustus]
LVFQNIITEFLKYFPKDLNNIQEVNDFLNEISIPEIKNLKKYIYQIRNLSNVFHFPQARHSSFKAYVDRLFAILLNRNVNIYIQSEIFYNIYMNYSLTNGNRLRFEKFLRKPIIELGEHIKSITSLYRDTNFIEDIYINEGKNSVLPEIPLEMKFWRSQYYAIWKVWFLRPIDNDILLYDSSQLKTAGYAIKRKEQLFKYVRQKNDGSLEAKLEVNLPYKLNTIPSLEKNEYLIFKPVPIQMNEIYSLEIEIDNKTIVFNQFPFIKVFYLKNKTFNKVKFQFQVYPFESFRVEPSYGELMPKKRIKIIIKYIYNNKAYNSCSNINGFIKLRSFRGYPIERINLIGITLPSIKINTKELDFGMVPPQTERMNFFVIKNLKNELNICNIFILEKKYSSLFIISEKQVTIEKNDSKIITLTLSIPKVGEINCKCVITTKMGEIYFIKLKAVVDYSIDIDKKINFGPTDIYYKSSSKKINIENKDPIYPLSIPLIPSSKEIVINNNEQVILKPKEKKQIKIEFNSMITGTRNEKVEINNPISNVNNININALSGPIVLIPIFEEVGFPITFPFTEASIKIPLINVIDEKVKCLVTLPKNTPFNISLFNNESALLPHNNTNSTIKDLYFEIKERSTIFIKVTYCSWTQGLFRVNLNFELDYPYKLHLYNICLTACCVSKSKKSYDKEKMARIRKFFNNRFDCPLFKGTEPDNIESMYKDNSSKVLVIPSQFSVMSKYIFLEDKDELLNGEKFKKLLDNTENNFDNDQFKNNVDQPYHIFISGPFITDISLDGVLKAYSYLYIPLYLDYKRFSNLINKENYYYTCFGHISIMDENYLMGSVCTLLQGFNNTMIDYEVGKNSYSPTTIDFPICEQYHKNKKVIYLRNKTNYNIQYDIELNDIESNIYKNRNPSTENEDCLNKEINYNNIQEDNSTVFKFQKPNGSNIIKPFEIIPLEITCMSFSLGSFKALMKIKYNSPNIFKNSIDTLKKEDDEYTEYYKNISKRDILDGQFYAPNILFSSLVGTPEISISKELLYFGDIMIGNSSKKDLFVINKGIPLDLYFYTLSPYIMGNSKLFLNFKGKDNNLILFEGKQTGIFNSYLITKYNNRLEFIPLSAYCGKMKIETNIGQLIRNVNVGSKNFKDNFWEHSDLALDYNSIEVSKFKSLEFIIYNKGTIDISLSDIIASNDNIITWHIKEDKQDNYNILYNSKLLLSDNSIINKNEYYEEMELDWDEISYVMEKQNISSNKLIKNNKSNFPIIISPNESVKLIITAWGFKEGKFKETLDFVIDIGISHEIYTLYLKGDISHPLSLKKKSVEFGIVPVNKTSNVIITFSNDSNRLVKWWIEFIETKYNILNAKKRKEGKETSSSIIHPFKVFPDKGEIGAKKTQNIEIKFMPNIPQCDIETKVVIRTNIFDRIPLRLHGIGGSVILKTSITNVDFGCCAVGSKQVVPITISNVGLIYSRFSTECTNECFKADPEFGVIKNGETIIIRLSYNPTISDEIHKGYFKLIPENSSDNKPIYISLNGMSGYPDIVINKKIIDFGYTVLRGKNVKSLVIRNKGSVPGVLNFTSKHLGLSIEEVDESDNIVIEPKSKKKIHVIYVPTKMEVLNTHGVFSNVKLKAESILVNFKAVVCQPKLVIDPPDFYSIIDFGICHIDNTYEKKITISNEGIIDLKYNIKMDFEQYNKRINDENDDNDEYDDDDDDEKEDNNNLKINKLSSDSQKAIVILKFSPSENKNYRFNYSLNYGFQPICGSISGIGGIGNIKFYPKVDSINFGICRINKDIIKKVYIKNIGNIGEKFIIRPIIPDTPEDIYRKDIEFLNENSFDDNNLKLSNENQIIKDEKNLLLWESYLKDMGLKLLNYGGICNPNEEKSIDFIYHPIPDKDLNVTFKLYTKRKSEEIVIIGRSGKSILKLYDINDNEISLKKGIKFGMKSVDSINKMYLKLQNEGDFGIDFMINKSIKKIFEVYPETGYIPPNSSLILTLIFFPKEENIFKWCLNIMWEDGIIKVPVHAKSGTGKINITFPAIYEDNTSVIKEKVDNEYSYIMKFSPIPLHSYASKNFFVYNSGIVGVDVEFKITGEAFTLAFTSEIQKYNENTLGTLIINNKKNTNNVKYDWKKELNIHIPSHHYIEISCRYYAENEFNIKEKIYINSSCYYGIINVSGKGGTVLISHNGNLEFNDINAKYTYSKNIVLRNMGTIDTKLSFKWTMSSHKHYKNVTPGKIHFSNTFDSDDPRSEIIRNYLIIRNKLKSNSKDIQMSVLDETKKYANIKKGNNYYWEILRLNILSKYFDNDSSNLINYMKKFEKDKVFNSFIKSFVVIIDMIGRHRYKRKKNLFKYIENTPITSQSLSNIVSYMRVLPEEIILPANQNVTINVDLNLEDEMDYIATLHCISNFSVVEEHLIPLIANPKHISILCDMNKIDFSTQSIGETEIITKEFKNVGSKDIAYTINSNNEGLRIIPDEGELKQGESVDVKFIFQPMTERVQSYPIIFQPELSQPIRLQFFGAGGYSQISLKNGSTYEFGNCVIGKKLDVFLPIENKGTAVLKINTIILYSNGTFSEGPDWPNERIFVEPKTTYRLPLVFKPDNEKPPPATVSIITPLENYEINLSGVGKDAMIIISSLYLEYNDCIIGNQYEQKVILRNTGDVFYPVTMELNDILPGIKFFPDKFSIPPFSSYEVTIQFKPTIEINKNIFVDVNSPYSKNQIRLKLHSGYVKLFMEKNVYNFGMFEMSTVPKMKFDVKNVGTIGTHYSIVHRGSCSNIQFTNRTGFIKPNESNTVKMSFINTYKHFGPFNEIFDIKTDLIDSVYPFKVIGDCNHALIHPQEISTVDLGLCPIFEYTKKNLTLKNYGRYPLTFKLKVVYPIQCNVTKGVLNENESQIIKFSWMPTGGYLLHSTATLSSNAGNHTISIIGKGTLPKINISSDRIDYGICAMNCTYEKTLTITNVGLVKFKWSIQQQNQDFTLSIKEGELNVNESIDVKINFVPKCLKCYQSLLYLECKGLTSREIQLVGVGGNMKFYISPRIVDMGICPKGLLISGSFTIKSKGEVTIYANFSEGKSVNKNNMIMTPKPVILLPGKSEICKFDIIPNDEGPFEYRLIISTKEKTYKIKIIGI